MPVNLYFIDAMPLTGVGKIFKPTLRWDAAQRAASRMLADLAPAGGTWAVTVAAHAVHGSLIEVAVAGVAAVSRAPLEERIRERLNPLVMAHQIVWTD